MLLVFSSCIILMNFSCQNRQSLYSQVIEMDMDRTLLLFYDVKVHGMGSDVMCEGV